MLKRDFSHKFFLACLGILTLIKLYLIRYSEIVAESSDPESYLNRASKLVWFSQDIGLGTLGHPPGYSLFVCLFSWTGIPLRLGHELVYWLSIVALIYGLRCWGIPRFVCTLLFASLLFHPLTFSLFNHARSEVITVTLYNFLFAVTFYMTRSKSSKELLLWSLCCGIILGFSAVTRPESMLIDGYLVGLACVIWLQPNFSKRQRRSRFLLSVVLPFVVFMAVQTLFSYANQFFLGVPGVSLSDAPNYKGVYTQLMQIDAGVENPFHVPVSQAQLKLAYEASPSFAKLEPYLSQNREIKGSHLGWQLIYALREATGETDSANLYQLFAPINQELEASFEEGKLSKKRLLMSYMDPNIDVWISSLPTSTNKVLTQFILPPLSQAEKVFPGEDSPRSSINLFNRVANRRAALVGYFNASSKIINVVKLLTKITWIINIGGLISFLILLFYYLHSGYKSQLTSDYIFVASGLWFLTLGRLCLYILVDASSWSIPLRYLFPGMPLFTMFSILSCYILVDAFVKRTSDLEKSKPLPDKVII